VFDFLGQARNVFEKETQTYLVFGVVFTISFTVALSTNVHKRQRFTDSESFNLTPKYQDMTQNKTQ